jgi:hypothetical protein
MDTDWKTFFGPRSHLSAANRLTGTAIPKNPEIPSKRLYRESVITHAYTLTCCTSQLSKLGDYTHNPTPGPVSPGDQVAILSTLRGLLAPARLPTACAVGCDLSPLRGWGAGTSPDIGSGLVSCCGRSLLIEQPLHLIHYAVHLFDGEVQGFVGGHVDAGVFQEVDGVF